MLSRRLFLVVLQMLLVAHSGRGLRTCTDVQYTLLACLSSSDPGLYVIPGGENVTQLCWHAGRLLECVAEATDTCPHLPLLADPDFQRAMRDLRDRHDTYCHASPETSTHLPAPSADTDTDTDTMPSDQGQACDPVAALTACNEFMVGVQPGDVKAMCGSGADYLDCLKEVVDTCPEHSRVLNFDLEQAIHSTRHMLQYDCPPEQAAVFACAELTDAAQLACAYYLPDDVTTDYCQTLLVYLNCLTTALRDCPEPALQTIARDQYRHHCQ